MALRRAFTQAILRRSQQTSSSSSSSTSAGLSALYSSSSSSQNRMISTSSRSNYAGGESTQTSVEKFQELFDKYRPSMMDPPGTPSTYMPAEDVAKSGEEEVKNAGPPPETVKLNFRLPHEAVFADAEVNMVLVPAETGDFGILPGHVPVVAKLRPGVVSVENKESVTSRVRRQEFLFWLARSCFPKDLFFSQNTLKEVITLIIRFRRARLYLRFIDDRKNADLLYIYLFSHHSLL